MTKNGDDETEHHLQEAVRHLREARDGDLRKTNAVALEEVSDTVSTILREQDGEE